MTPFSLRQEARSQGFEAPVHNVVGHVPVIVAMLGKLQAVSTTFLNSQVMKKRSLVYQIFFLFVVIFLLPKTSAFGNTSLVVDTLSDETDGDFSAGHFSLREAIAQANLSADPVTITFDPALFAGGDATITLTNFDTGLDTDEFGPFALRIQADITIQGPSGNNGLTIRRNPADPNEFRLFYVYNATNPSAARLTLEYLNISGGFAHGGNGGFGRGGAAAGMGGAIFNRSGTVLINASTFTANSAAGGNGNSASGVGSGGGGGVGQSADSTTPGGPNAGVGGNPGTAGGFGGGGGNGAKGGFGGGGGAFGIGGFGGGGGNLHASAFGGDSGGNRNGGAGASMGGAIFNYQGTVGMTNSTFSGNTLNGASSSGYYGGAVFNYNGSIAALQCTFYANGGRGVFAIGDGAGSNAVVVLNNCILAGSTKDFESTTINGGSVSVSGGTGNLIMVNSSTGPYTGGISSSGDPLLQPLARNGGPTLTHSFCTGSPAFNAGVSASADAWLYDQRGSPRSLGSAVDIGALETSAAEIDLQGGSPAVSIVAGDATPSVADNTDFGISPIAGAAVVHTFTITNSGTDPLTVFGLNVTGANATDFSVSGLVVPATVAVNGSTTFTVSFIPSGPGPRTATVLVANNDCDEGNYNFAVQGAGATAPDIAVAQSGPLTDGVGSVSFGSVNAGTSSNVLTFTITNPGTADLTGLSITNDGADAADFTVSAPSGTNIPVGTNSVTFTVTFVPGAISPRSAAIHIASNLAGSKNPFDIALTGTGLNNPPAAGADILLRPDSTRVAKVFLNTLLANDSDFENDTLSITSVGNALPAGATVTIVGGNVVYTVPGNTSGNGSFTYTLSDGTHNIVGNVTVTQTSLPTTAGTPNALAINQVANNFTIQFLGIPGRTYDVQYTTSTSPPYTWNDFPTPAHPVVPDSGVFGYTDVNPPDPARLYRAVLLP